MSHPELEALEELFAETVEAMPDDEFDSHEFILVLAQQNQGAYIRALAVYADGKTPFKTVHGEIAKRLKRYTGLVEHVGNGLSTNIFGESGENALWRKVS